MTLGLRMSLRVCQSDLSIDAVAYVLNRTEHWTGGKIQLSATTVFPGLQLYEPVPFPLMDFFVSVDQRATLLKDLVPGAILKVMCGHDGRSAITLWEPFEMTLHSPEYEVLPLSRLDADSIWCIREILSRWVSDDDLYTETMGGLEDVPFRYTYSKEQLDISLAAASHAW